MFHELLKFNEEVQEAINKQQPVVVLDSSLLSPRISYPDSVNAVQTLEKTIREHHAVPATVALHQGYIHFGISTVLMRYLAKYKKSTQASPQDLAFILSQKLSASTTVAATLYCMQLANLSILAIGGIGGGANCAENYGEVLADLNEFSLSPATIICSGVKSILTLPKILETLASYGIPVIGYQSDEFPAFYSHSSGISLLHRVDSPEEIAQLMFYQHQLELKKSIVIANPIPKKAEISDHKILPLIKQVRKEERKTQSKVITPQLLQRIAEVTAEEHLKSNIELIKNNAVLAAQVAVAYCLLYPEKKIGYPLDSR